MKVSVITPSFNQARFIERTILSVANQYGVEIEHVVVDGGSLDGTIEVLRRFGNLVKWTSERDRGQTHAVNKGMRATDGEIIGWLNSDDIYYPGAVARVMEVFKANSDIDVVYGMANHIDTEDYAFEPYPTERWDFDRLKEICFICQPALFFRRRVIENCGFLDESLRYCMDYEYWLRLGRSGIRFAYLEEKLAGSRMYPENKTLGAKVQVHREINDMFKRKFGNVPDRWLFNYAHALIGNRIDRRSRPVTFAFGVGVLSIAAGLKWNKRVSRSMRNTVARYCFSQRFKSFRLP